MADQPKDSSRDFEAALEGQGAGPYLLRLYVSGTTARSIEAISNIRRICEERLKDRFELEIIDTYQKPHLAKKDQVLALPTLIKELPPPLRRIIGDLSDKERVLVGLDLVEKDQDSGQ